MLRTDIKIFLKKTKKKPKKAQDIYKNHSEENKVKKRQYHWDQNKNLSEGEKQKKLKYMRNYYLAREK